jgi:hypothetical protein
MIKIDKIQNRRWPPAAILNFGQNAITFERFELETSNLARTKRITMGTSRDLVKID